MTFEQTLEREEGSSANSWGEGFLGRERESAKSLGWGQVQVIEKQQGGLSSWSRVGVLGAQACALAFRTIPEKRTIQSLASKKH